MSVFTRWFQYRTVAAFICCIAILPSLTFAAVDKYYEKSLYDSAQPYLIVTGTPEPNSTERAPGIYAPTGKGEWEAVILGKVMTGKLLRGILSQLPIGVFSRKYEALAIVDGKLILFNTASRASKADSYIVLGSGNGEVVDGFTQQPIRIPAIESLEQVSIAHEAFRETQKIKGEAVIVSIKLKQEVVQGNGITFALGVRATAHENLSKMTLADKPMLIDYQFHKQNVLASFMFTPEQRSDMGLEPMHILSPIYLRSLAILRDADTDAVKRWRNEFASFANQISKGKSDNEEIYAYPTYSLNKKQWHIPLYPRQALSFTSGVSQKFDPVTGQNAIIKSSKGEVVLRGTVDFFNYPESKSRKKALKVYAEKAVAITNSSGGLTTHNTSFSLLSVNKDLYLVYSKYDRVSALKLLTFDKMPEDFDAVLDDSPNIEGQNVKWLVLSVKSGLESYTSIFYLDSPPGAEDINSTLSVIKSVYLNKRFLNAIQIHERMHEQRTEDFVQGNVLFDYTTPGSKTGRDYTAAFDPTLPMIDFFATGGDASPRGVSRSLMFDYEKALEITEVHPEIFHFLLNEKGLQGRLSGLQISRHKSSRNNLYLKDQLGPNPHPDRIIGQLIFPPTQTHKKNPQASWSVSQPIMLKTSESEATSMTLRTSIVTLDPSFQNGERNLRLALVGYMDPTMNSASRYAIPFISELDIRVQNIELNTKSILGINIIRNPFPESKNILIAIAHQSPNTRKRHLLLFERKLGFSNTVRNEISFKMASTDQIHPTVLNYDEKTNLDFETIQRWLRYDKRGNTYVLTDPNVNLDADECEFLEVGSSQTVKANTSRGRELSLKSLNEFREAAASGNSFLFDAPNANWIIKRRFELFDEIKLSLGLDSKISLDQIQVPTPKNQFANDSFPGFEEFLSKLASDPLPKEPIQAILTSDKEELHEMVKRITYNADNKVDFPNNKFSVNSNNLEILWIRNDKTDQADFIKNFKAVRSSPAQKKIIFVLLSTLLKTPRPKVDPDDSPIMLQDPLDTSSEAKDSFTPNALYLLATEGRKVAWENIAGLKNVNRASQVVMLGTADEWEKYKKEFSQPQEEQLLSLVTVNSRYLNGSWKIWKNHEKKKRPQAIAALLKDRSTKFEKELFPDIIKFLESVSAPDATPKARIVIVDPEIKDKVKRLALSEWDRPLVESTSSWSAFNPNLALSILRDPQHIEANSSTGKGVPLNQSEVLLNLVSAASAAKTGKQAVIFGDLNALGNGERPAAGQGQSEFLIKVPMSNPQSLGEVTVQPTLPHLLYLIATGGKKVSYEKFNDTVSKENPYWAPAYSSCFIGTPAEWARIQEQIKNVEGATALLDRFEIVNLPIPDPAKRRYLLEELFQKPEVQRLGYSFNAYKIHKNYTMFTPEEHRARVIDYLVSTAERFAVEEKRDPISGYITMVDELGRALFNDTFLRESKVINRTTVDRILYRIFNTPINISSLMPNDPLVMLNDPSAVAKLQEAGYEGSLELRRKLIQNLLSVTQRDPVKKVPSSFILFGDSSTGKTFLFETLVKMLNLTYYSYSDPTQNKKAQAMIVDVSKIMTTDGHDKNGQNNNSNAANKVTNSNGNQFTLEQIKNHVYTFLEGENGHRGFLLFDDIHKCSDSVKAELLIFIQGIVDSPGSKVLTPQGIPINVRNLNIFLTVNPTDNQEKRKKFIKDGEQMPAQKRLEKEIMAQLDGGGFSVESSFFQRWGVVQDINKFPYDAKAPKLIEALRNSSQDLFNNNNQFVMFTPEVVAGISKAFSGEGARSFISEAPRALINKGADPRPETTFTIVGSQDHASWRAPDAATIGSQVESFVNARTRNIVVNDRPDGQLEFTKFIANSFRMMVYDALSKGYGSNNQIAGEPITQKSILAPALHAITTYLHERPELPLQTLSLDATKFGAHSNFQIQEFSEFIEKEDIYEGNFFPITFIDELPMRSSFDLLMGNIRGKTQDPSRASVIVETTNRLNAILEKGLRTLVRVNDLKALPTEETWIRSLVDNDDEQRAIFKKLPKQLTEEFIVFFQKITSSDLVENINSGSYPELQVYDISRLFLNALDKAITRLTWSASASFLIRGIKYAAHDLSVGQLKGVQHLLFKSSFSILKTVTPEIVMQTSTNNDTYNSLSPVESARAGSNFLIKCKNITYLPSEDKETL